MLSYELVEVARIDGAGEFYTFNCIVLPVIKPALAMQAIFAFVGNWNNFMTPFVLLSSTEKYTLPMLVQMLRGDIYRTEYGGIYLGVAVSLIPRGSGASPRHNRISLGVRGVSPRHNRNVHVAVYHRRLDAGLGQGMTVYSSRLDRISDPDTCGAKLTNHGGIYE